ncbi:hypothetical protein Tco_0900384 [Tanacetum coccineum]
METCDPVGTPMEIKDKLDLEKNEILVDATKYQSMICALMYLTSSRPNIVHATCLCAWYQAQPTEKHLKEDAETPSSVLSGELCGESENSQCVTNDLSNTLIDFTNGFIDSIETPKDRPTDDNQGVIRPLRLGIMFHDSARTGWVYPGTLQ